MLALAQLEQLQLQNERARLELELLRRPAVWHGALTPMVPMITALVALAGFGWGLIQYGIEQSRNRAAAQEQSKLAQQTAEREFMKPWLENQRETYIDALTAAAAVANHDEPRVRQQATNDFWGLYQGKMILVETTEVSKAMVAFGNCLNGQVKCDKEEMNERCRILGTTMAQSMAATARMSFQEFAANQFQYSDRGTRVSQ